MYDELINRLKNCATQAAPCKTCGLIEDDSCSDTLMKQAADAIEELQRAVNFHKFNSEFWEDKYNSLADEKWIPVTERLPEEKTYVLILFDTIAGKMQGVCFLYKDDDGHNCWTWLDRLGKNLFDIQPTHWMPLPTPPTEEEGE